MSTMREPIDFRGRSAEVPAEMSAAMRQATARTGRSRAEVVAAFGNERWQAQRRAGQAIRMDTLLHLDQHLTTLEAAISAAGGHVHWAADAESARTIVLEIAQAHGVTSIVKSKSWTAKEIELEAALRAAGMNVLETDLGDYIVQLAGPRLPKHIVPAAQLTRQCIADLFRQELGVAIAGGPAADPAPEPQTLTLIARERLRAAFLAADMGLTGANFMVAESGTLVMVTNEGNGRMCATVPPLQVVLVPITKVVPDWAGLAVLLDLLPRVATGQKMTSYVQFMHGPRANTDGYGPRELHVVLIDNGRSKLLGDEMGRRTLCCIRCEACLHVCPVYNTVGGDSYGWVQPGPIGAILAPQVLGLNVAHALPFASTLCGACNDVCPVMVPFTEVLLNLRSKVVAGDGGNPPAVSPVVVAGATMAAAVLSSPVLYRGAAQAAAVLQTPWRKGDWLAALPPPMARWTAVRPLPVVSTAFRRAWHARAKDSSLGAPLSRARRGLAWAAALLVAGGLAAWLGHRRRGVG